MITTLPLLFLSSLTSFFALTLIIELFFALFRVKSYRARVICRLFPILKLPFDVALFLFYGKSILKNLNPFTCDKFLYDLISQHVPHIWLQVALIGLVAFSLWRALHNAVQFYHSTKYLQRLSRLSPRASRQVPVGLLKSRLNALGCQIAVTDEMQVPCAFGRRTILMPATLLETLPQDEYEAVLAHELEHLRSLDPYVKMASLVISKLFWWVPMNWWLRRLETDQEYASDLSVKSYGVDNHSLASAVLKVVAEGKERQTALQFSSTRQSVRLRIQMILNDTGQVKAGTLGPIFATFASLAASLLLTFWIC